jgi:pimeloyl-ACP methyl ester carboxylesterase/ABC-type transport system involved in multi-copper enzyme maturation permease subunit
MPRFEPAPCPFNIPPGEAIQCGYLSVPEDRAVPDGPTIRLGVALLKSHSSAPHPDPFLQLNGGPGGAVVEKLPAYLSIYRPLLETRDVILYDQRGAGWSQPALDCPELAEAGSTVSAYLACRDRWLAQGVDLAAYSTAANVADARDLWQALGYTQVNLYGLSYGAILAQHIVRAYPESIRSVVLDSPYPLETNLFADGAGNYQTYLEHLFARCAADWACRAAYPALPDAYRQTFARLRQTPVTLTTVNPATGSPVTLVLDETALVETVFRSSYREVPALIYDLRDGDYRAFLKLKSADWQMVAGPAAAVRASVRCSDAVLRVTPAQLAEALPDAEAMAWRKAYLNANAFALQLCDQWPARAPVPETSPPGVSSIPALILTGEYDAGIPPAYDEKLGLAFSRSFIYRTPGLMHGVLAGSGACASSLLLSFLEHPTQAPDTGCMATSAAPVLNTTFVLRAAVARQPTQVAVILLALLSLWSLGQTGAAIARQRFRGFAWRHSLRSAGWLRPVVSAGITLVALMLGRAGWLRLVTVDVVALIMPMAAALQAAYLFSPEDEPALEVLLAAPRPPGWIVLERLAALWFTHGSAALAVSLVASQLTGESFAVTVARWLPLMGLLTGLALCLTLITRRAVISLVVTCLLWFALAFFGNYLIVRWPFAWPCHFYLTPAHPDYFLNRFFIALMGIELVALAATRFMRSEERLLLGNIQVRAARRTAPSLAQSRLDGFHPSSVRLPPFLSKLAALVSYELLLHRRRPTLGIVFVGLALMPILGAFIGQSQFSGYRAALAAGLLSPELVSARVTATLALPLWIGSSLVIGLLAPLVAADVLPKDRQYGVDELLNSLPLTPGLYLTSKLLGLWLSLLIGASVVAGVSGLAWQLLVGPFNWVLYTEMWLALLAWLFINSGLSMLLAVGQPSVRRAAAVGAAWAFICLVGLGVGLAQQMSAALAVAHGAAPDLGFADWLWLALNPGRAALFLHYALGGEISGVPVELLAALHAVVTSQAVWWTLAGGAAQTALAWLCAWGWLKRKA